MSVPEFSIAQWRYPEQYDVEELPTPGQSYIHPDTYVSFMIFLFIFFLECYGFSQGAIHANFLILLFSLTIIVNTANNIVTTGATTLLRRRITQNSMHWCPS